MQKKINYTQVLKETRDKVGLPLSKVKAILEAYFEVIELGLKKDKKIHTPLGVFSIKLTKARSGTTLGKKWSVGPHYRPVLRQSSKVKRMLRKVRQ